MASIFDLDFNALTVTPYGFDTIFQSGTGSVSSVVGTGGGVTPKSGVGVYNLGPTPAIETRFPGINMIALGTYWVDIEPSPGAYTWVCRNSGALQSLDVSIDDARTKGYKILLRIFGGCNMPIGGWGSRNQAGTVIDWAAKPFVHQGTSFAGVERVSFVSRDISLSHICYVPWAPDSTLRAIYQRLMTALSTYLNGTTAAGTKRSDYIFYVPVMMPTENGTEMTLNAESGTFSPTAAIKLDNGVTYGPGTSNPTGDVAAINNACMYSHIDPVNLPASPTTTDKRNYIQAVWIQAWKDACDIQVPLLPCDSGIVYGSIWGGSQEGTAGQVRDYVVPKYGKTKLFGQTTDYTVNYEAYNKGKSDFMQTINQMGGKIGFQTQAQNPTNSNPGMKPVDWITAMDQAASIYKVHFMETQQGNFTDATYGSDNLAYAIGTFIPAVAANALAWENQNQQGHALKFVASTTDQAYGRKIVAGTVKSLFMRVDMNRIVSNSGTSILIFSTTDSGDSIQVRIDGSNIPRISVSGTTDWTGTSPLQNGDILELRHVLNGATSGYVFRINKTIVHQNLAIAQGTATRISQIDVGLKSKIAAEIWHNRFAADDATWVGDVAVPTNLHAPIIDLVSPVVS